ncbi:MAG: EAL domain-containing protein [Kineosporiaceae bacterium]
MSDGDEAAGAAPAVPHAHAVPTPRQEAGHAPVPQPSPMPSAPGHLDSLLLAGLLDAEPAHLFFKDVGGRFLRASRGIAEALGADTPQDLVGRTVADFLPAPDAARRTRDDQAVIRTGVPIVELHEQIPRPGWEDHRLVTSRYPVRDEQGEIVATLGVIRDITVRKLMEQQLEGHAARLGEANAELTRVQRELREILQTSPDPTVRFDDRLRIRFANPAALRLIGREEDVVVGRTLEDLCYPPGLDALALARCLAGRVDVEYETQVRLPGGRTSYLHARLVPEHGPDGPDGPVCGVLLVGRDLTDRKRAEDLLADRAVRDPLTGLANRVLFTDRLQQALMRLDRQPGSVAVLFLDLDGFKQVNVRLGHGAGDVVLTEVARRLQQVARRGDTVGRLGGDEFVVLCERISGTEDAVLLADRIGRALAHPFAHEGRTTTLSASIGIRVVGRVGVDSLDAEGVLREANDALDQAKTRGSGHAVFDPDLREQLSALRGVESQLRQALETGQFHLAYQPLVSLSDNSLVGTEALLRWNHPERGLVSPSDFVPIAEDSGQIVAIGAWVLDEALRQLAEWNRRRAGSRPLTMAVNLSARQLTHPHLVDEVAAALARHDVPASQLCLEVTETALLEEALSTVEVFRRLSRLGVQLALDDFGTGYSSLVHLRRFPVDVLKIDRQFVSGLDGGAVDDAIVAAVTAMAHALGMVTVAEGIETPEQLAELVRLGCDEGQGYLLARPLAPAVLEADAIFTVPVTP